MSPVVLRLAGERNFYNIYRRGGRFKKLGIQLNYLKSGNALSRVAVVVSRKVSSLATRRNLYKRRLWAAIRENHMQIPKRGYNLIIAARPEIKELSYLQTKETVGMLITKITKDL